MAVVDLFSKRQKRLRGEVPDVYTYDTIPEPLRVQIIQIFMRSLALEGSEQSVLYRNDCICIVNTLKSEYGVFSLCEQEAQSPQQEIFVFINHEENIEKVLDAVEIAFRILIENAQRGYYSGFQNSAALRSANATIEELNTRFKEHGVGYQFENGQIIRVDSQLIHAEAVKPALQLLSDPAYAGAQDEFLKAYEHHRHGHAKEAMNEALKALESTLKSICIKRNWTFDPTAQCRTLLTICYGHDLVPKFWQEHLAAIKALLEGGVPTGRNKLSGHGQGETPTEVPEHIVAYVLHMTASAIVFLVNAEKQLP